jgi:hypothetical protein
VTAWPAPPAAVLAAFGLQAAELRPLAVPTWLAGDVVLKPDIDPEFQAWLATAVARVPRRGFRLADPLPALDGSWVVDGWSATRWVAGDSVPTSGPTVEKWALAIEGGRAFHRAVAGLARPDFLARRDSWWTRADRRAWGESGPAGTVPELAPTARVLEAACRPLGDVQLVHGDLAGNVLLHERLDPAVIDVSPYWRPPAYAEGVLVADALCWYGAQPSLLDELGVPVPAVARAMLFRLWTTHERVVDGVRVDDLPTEARAYADAAAAMGLA